MTTQEIKQDDDEYINIELDTKCSCLQSKLNSHLAS
ncbi:unnamed protein product, partial [Rotaria sp. Silwood1]